MARSVSPLRYPGGKSCLHDVVSQTLRLNGLQRGHYAEPYAGGAGLALALLFGGHADEIHLNDIDESIAAFWRAVLEKTDELIGRIEETPVTIEEWHRQREVYLNPSIANSMDLAFSTFFLNRTNRSGIIKGAGVIGGLNQSGAYSIDCRYNVKDLVKRIRRISKYKHRIHFRQSDAIQFMMELDRELPERSLFCIDPPYYNKGSSLYTSFYSKDDHEKVSKCVLSLRRPWLLTYDNVPQISSLYKGRRQFSFNVNYSVQTKRIGKELLVASKGLKLPLDIRENVLKAVA